MSIICMVKMNSLDIIRKYKYSCIVLLGFIGYTDPEKIFNSFELNAKQSKVNTFFCCCCCCCCRNKLSVRVSPLFLACKLSIVE